MGTKWIDFNGSQTSQYVRDLSEKTSQVLETHLPHRSFNSHLDLNDTLLELNLKILCDHSSSVTHFERRAQVQQIAAH